MTFKTILLAGASVALLGACSAPNEYNTYEVTKKPSSYGMKSWKFWDDNEDTDQIVVEMQHEEDAMMSEPVVITAPGGRVE